MELKPDRKEWLYWSVISTRPLVTISSIDLDKVVLADVMGDMSARFEGTKGTHFLAPTWNLEKPDLSAIREAIRRTSQLLPGHRFIVAAGSELEAFRLSGHGIKCIPCNASIFQDETRWNIQTKGFDVLPQSDAFYNAHFGAFKRHELCADLEAPLFVYGFNVRGGTDELMDAVRDHCPSAVFVNHALNDGEYRLLNEREIGRVLHHTKTSLCLSAEEGHMRASIQSLLCGVPVVSTPSIGGRDRYYSDDTGLIVEATPSAVRLGVDTLKHRQLSPQEVRRATMSMIEFDRRNFLCGVNKIVRRFHGKSAPELCFDGFRGWKFQAQRTSDFLEKISDVSGAAD